MDNSNGPSETSPRFTRPTLASYLNPKELIYLRGWMRSRVREREPLPRYPILSIGASHLYAMTYAEDHSEYGSSGGGPIHRNMPRNPALCGCKIVVFLAICGLMVDVARGFSRQVIGWHVFRTLHLETEDYEIWKLKLPLRGAGDAFPSLAFPASQGAKILRSLRARNAEPTTSGQQVRSDGSHSVGNGLKSVLRSTPRNSPARRFLPTSSRVS